MIERRSIDALSRPAYLELEANIVRQGAVDKDGDRLRLRSGLGWKVQQKPADLPMNPRVWESACQMHSQGGALGPSCAHKWLNCSL